MGITQFRFIIIKLYSKPERLHGFIFQRSEIINAIYEPTEEECEWKADAEEEISVSISTVSEENN